jgi:predicted DsbA family dithiol-disulfide isomerase
MTGKAMTDAPVVLDVWADIACPWCFIGVKHLATAVDGRNDVVIRHRAYELQPTLPPEGIERAGYFERIFGSVEAYQEANAHLIASAQGTGIAFNLEPMPKVANTHFAHRVVAAHDDDPAAQRAVVLALFSAYFEQALDISDQAVVLAAASAASGRSAQAIQAALDADGDGAQVDADLAEASQIGVRAVPTFVANGHLALQGAQPPEAITDLLRRVRTGA